MVRDLIRVAYHCGQMTFRSNAGVVVSGETCSVMMAVLMLKRVLAALCELLLLVLVALLRSSLPLAGRLLYLFD